MATIYDAEAGKRAVNLSVNGDLLDKAKQHGINLSATFEHAPAEALNAVRREQWLTENRKAMGAYNEHVEAAGVYSDGLRSF